MKTPWKKNLDQVFYPSQGRGRREENRGTIVPASPEVTQGPLHKGRRLICSCDCPSHDETPDSDTGHQGQMDATGRGTHLPCPARPAPPQVTMACQACVPTGGRAAGAAGARPQTLPPPLPPCSQPAHTQPQVPADVPSALLVTEEAAEPALSGRQLPAQPGTVRELWTPCRCPLLEPVWGHWNMMRCVLRPLRGGGHHPGVLKA